MEIVANVLSFAGHAVDTVTGFVLNDKPGILLSNILSSFLSLAAMACLGSLAGCIGVVVTIVRLCVIYLKDKNGWHIDWAVLVFSAGYACVFLDNDTVVASLMFLGNMVAFLPKWFCQDAQRLRIGACLANLVFIVPNILIHNFSAVPFHVFNSVTIFLAYLKWYGTVKPMRP